MMVIDLLFRRQGSRISHPVALLTRRIDRVAYRRVMS
jgi:hypothetical protein